MTSEVSGQKDSQALLTEQTDCGGERPYIYIYIYIIFYTVYTLYCMSNINCY